MLKPELRKIPIAMIMAADKFGKYTQLDKDEQERMPWNEIVPSYFEASADINLLNPKLFDPNIEEKRRKLRSKLSGEIDDADYTMITDAIKKKIYFNRSQIESMTVAANSEFIVAFRGYGKSEGIDVPRMLRNVLDMPRSLGALLSPTHTKMLTNTLPAVKIWFSTDGI